MLFLELKQVQATLPEYKVYAFKMTYSPELEVYQVVMWTDHPVGLDDKYQLTFDIHPGMATTEQSLLESIRTEAGRIIDFHKENTWKRLSH
jgi:hypothetical protein